MTDPDPGFVAIASAVAPTGRALAHAARALILDVYPAAVEVPWPKQSVVGYGVGPKKMTEHFCYLAVYDDHVNVGFNYGAELPDPDGLLEGTGKLLRHYKAHDLADLARPALRRLLAVATRHRMPSVPSHHVRPDREL